MRETVIDLIRHGEPLGGRRYRGHSIDDPLSETGWSQMWRSVGSQAPWDGILSSPLLRCRAFAQALADRHGIPLRVEPAFREIGFGTWEGRTAAQIRQQDPAGFEAFHLDPVNRRPPGAEPLTAFMTRVTQAYTTALEDPTSRHRLIVCHAGVIRALIVHALRMDPAQMRRIQVPYAAMTRLCHDGYGDVLAFHNASLAGQGFASS